jgi:hypothetical protein
MSVFAIVTLVIIVINYFWNKVAHEEYVGDLPPAWINRVTNKPWLLANIVWWLFAALTIYMSVACYFSGDFFFTLAGLSIFVYAFIRRTPKAYRSTPFAALSKLIFIPIWAMVFIGMTDRGLVYFSLCFALWSLTSSVLQGRFIYLTKLLSEALDDSMRDEEATA